MDSGNRGTLFPFRNMARRSAYAKVVRDEIAQYCQKKTRVCGKQIIHKFILTVLRVWRRLSLSTRKTMFLYAKRAFHRFHPYLQIHLSY